MREKAQGRVGRDQVSDLATVQECRRGKMERKAGTEKWVARGDEGKTEWGAGGNWE